MGAAASQENQRGDDRQDANPNGDFQRRALIVGVAQPVIEVEHDMPADAFGSITTSMKNLKKMLE